LGVVARQEKADITGSTVTAKVGIGKNADGFGLIVEISANIPNVDPTEARALLEKAHQVCPYSKATTGNITVTLT
ncbi:OsmC family protein, partial [Streptomyces phaeochromogenes]